MENDRYKLEIVRLGLLIKELRIKEKIAQQQLAILCNVDRKTIYRIEKGEQNITISLLFTIAESLKINPSILISKIFSKNQ
ncbi:helix-turn-helix domain-containing protein [Flavobacterium sp. N1736]|uniref:helix-turn-helix domain-containing protein n=1 Tax=Flavobacterium sp. N1736 TaxID=2986823 RepID=UPI002225531E|nr:helix-turn-helix transcriptional regulator [Flavobacterium sp. N1736]